jgi:hypothetical protein
MELQLANADFRPKMREMGLPTESVTLTAPQIAELNQKLSDMRHNINNNLALLVAALELIRRKPEIALKMADNMAAQPDRINVEIQAFSSEFEKTLGITRQKIELPPEA